MRPTIIICSGSFHTPIHYAKLAESLRAKGYDVISPELPTMKVSAISAVDVSNPDFDRTAPAGGWPDGYSDVEVVRREIRALTEQGKSVVLVGHSYGGWLATESAHSELHERIRAKDGKQGGIAGLFYISGYILPVGQSINSFFSPQGDATPPPLFVTLHGEGKKGLVVPIRSEEFFFNDLPAEEAPKWAEELRAQPVIKSNLTMHLM